MRETEKERERERERERKRERERERGREGEKKNKIGNNISLLYVRGSIKEIQTYIHTKINC